MLKMEVVKEQDGTAVRVSAEGITPNIILDVLRGIAGLTADCEPDLKILLRHALVVALEDPKCGILAEMASDRKETKETVDYLMTQALEKCSWKEKAIIALTALQSMRQEDLDDMIGGMGDE